MNTTIRVDLATLLSVTDKTKERNIYIHPCALARDIFWQRLESLYSYLRETARSDQPMLDFGGGSGVFLKGLSRLFPRVDVVDLDTICAENIVRHLHLSNVNIYAKNISEYFPKDNYQTVVAADVLEHFYDLSVPISFIKRMLAPDGQLYISAPTENWLYVMGRILVGKKKPMDHYHSANEIIRSLCAAGFSIERKRFAPRYLASIPLFAILVCKLKSYNFE